MTEWLQITSGRGPAECGRAVWRVYLEILKEADEAGFAVRLLEAVSDRHPETFKSLLVAIDGEEEVSCFVPKWIGTVLWIGASPFRPYHKRKNWYVGVESITVPDELGWSPEEIKLETMRSSGPGGQHVNTTESAVRITHVPTGISAIAREERSQFLNRKLALARLNRLLEQRAAIRRGEVRKEKWGSHNRLERGNPIRVFRDDGGKK
ncbi:MAG: peptide chain release factor H [Syntrophobacteraceae bacterium]